MHRAIKKILTAHHHYPKQWTYRRIRCASGKIDTADRGEDAAVIPDLCYATVEVI